MIAENAYDVLLGHLYAGAGDSQRMSAFLGAIGTLTDSHITTFVRADLANPDASALLTVGVAPDEVLSWSEHAGENPWMQRYLPEIHAGGVCNGDAYVSHKEIMASQYYDGFLRHIDTQHSIGICAAHEQSRAVFLMMCRTGRAGAYGDDCISLFQRLAPHAVNAFALQVQFEHLNAQASRATRIQRGKFLLDAQWRWVGGNSVAEEMVAAGWWRGRLNAPLEAAHHITRKAWKALQCEIAQQSKTQAVVPLHDGAGALVAFASVHAYGSAAVGENMPCYVVFVRPLHLAQTDAVGAQLRKLFGLTSSEAVFTLALRTYGDAAHAASAVGIAGSSARTRLQSVFEKTSTHRQADLMLLIDALAETLA